MSNLKDFSILKSGTLKEYKGENGVDVVIPNGVKKIADYAFHRKRIASITFPDGLKVIDDRAFKNCLILDKINLPTNIATFEGSVLELIFNYFMTNENKIVMIASFLSQEYNLILNNKDAVRKIKANKKNIIDFAIRKDNVEILKKLFSLYDTINLDELNEYIEKSVNTTSIKVFLLEYKTKKYSSEKQEEHEKIKLEKELGFKELTLSDWKKIYSFDIDTDGVTITSYKGTDIDIVLPEYIGKYKVTAIGEYAFSPRAPRLKKEYKATREKIQSVSIPESIINIEKCAFSDCKNLADEDGFVVIRDILYNYYGSNDVLEIPDGITIIEDEALGTLTAYNIKSVLFPKNIKSIGENCFRFCLKLTSVTIPAGVTSIGDSAFYHCSNLTSITIPDSVTNISKNAFFNCENLASFTIPNSVTSIGDGAFYYCTSLATITLPDSVTSIGTSAFRFCKSLTSITIPNSVTKISDYAFDGCVNLTIHAPAGSYAEQYAKENNIPFVAE